MGMPDEVVTSLTKELLPELKCQGCTMYARPPILLCESGHVICSTCNKTATSCNNCKGKLIGAICIPLDNLAKKILYPCDHQKKGCNESFFLDKLEEHVEECQFRSYKCPFSITAYKCTWEGLLGEMENHITSKHLKSSDSRKIPPMYATTINYVDSGSNWFQALYLDGKVFFRYTEKTETWLYTCILYVGPRTRRFKYTVTVETPNGEESAAMTCMTHQFETDVKEIFNNGEGPCFNMAFVKRCLVKNQNLPIKIEIMDESSKK